jgi:23S rRNA pseudouridine1911/1915/1917 synthase
MELAGYRADRIAAELFAEFSRSRLQEWMQSGELTVDGLPVQPKQKLNVRQRLILDAEMVENERWSAQPIPLDVVFEDESILLINKPVGLVVHPAAGNPDGTLLNALLHHAPQVDQLPRCGIVHRLDKDTSGLLVVAKTLQAQTGLVRQLQARSMHRQYEAVCSGTVICGGKVDAPIGRHPSQRVKMAVVASGKPAVTHFAVMEKFSHFTHLRLKLETGRTHQIRVHMAHIRHPLVGDPVYGGRLKIPAGTSPQLDKFLHSFRHQALHAAELGFDHPATGEPVHFSVARDRDFNRLLELLEIQEKTRSAATVPSQKS